MKKILSLITAAVLATGLNSCENYLDVNDSPNYPTEDNLSSELLLPALEMNLAASYGNFLRIVGGYMSQQYAQTFGTSNYIDYSQFIINDTRVSALGYTQLYLRVVSNSEALLNKSEEEGDWGSYLAATTLRGFALTTMVDCFDSIPYTESVAGITQPKYDDGRTVYNGVIAEIDNALSKVDASDAVVTNFLFPGDKASSWIGFANALKLRLYTRLSNVDESVLPKIAEIINSGNLPTKDVAIKGCWTPNSGSENPFYAEEFATNFGSTQVNVVANIALVNTMQTSGYTDPRLAVFFNKNGDGKYVGGVSGTNFSVAPDLFNDKSFSRPAMAYDSPVYFITLADIEFYKAEYYARTGDQANAKTYYEKAIRASFATAGVEGADANIAAFPYEADNWKKSIGLAKWLALSGVDNFEAWCELRRLRYPAFDESINGTNIFNEDSKEYHPEVYKPGTLYTPIKVSSFIGNNKILERFPHASVSVSNNANCPAPSQEIFTMPVFWAK